MLLRQFSGVLVLEWFLWHPTKKIHFKELCRELKLSPPTVKAYCEEFLANGWLAEERQANLRIFKLRNESFVVKALKRTYILELLRRNKIDAIVDGMIISFALYGSYASGEYDEKSDIDLLAIGRKEQIHYDRILALGTKLGKTVQLTIIPLEKWETNKGSDQFMGSVLRNHVLLGGMPL